MDRNRVLTCSSCGGGFDLAENCKVVSMLAGMMSLGPGILLFSRIIHLGQGKVYIATGAAVMALCFALGAAGIARLTLRLVAKP